MSRISHINHITFTAIIVKESGNLLLAYISQSSLEIDMHLTLPTSKDGNNMEQLRETLDQQLPVIYHFIGHMNKTRDKQLILWEGLSVSQCSSVQASYILASS